MTSPLAKNYISTPQGQRKYYLEADKNGVPLQLQVPMTHEEYIGNGNQTVEPKGCDFFTVAAPLAGPLTIDFQTNGQNYFARRIRVLVIGGVGQDVIINFKAAPYNALVVNTALTVNQYTIAANANHQAIDIVFGELGAAIFPF